MTSDVPSAPEANASTLRALWLGFAGLLAATYCLIVLGALVRANGAGLACPDWPLCFGQLVPEFDLKIAFEWGHRTVAAVITALFLALSYLALRNGQSRPVVRRLVPLAAVVLALQIGLGALTVWKLLAYWSVTLHLLAGLTFAVLLLLVTLTLMEAAQPTPHDSVSVSSRTRVLTLITFALLVVQIGLGGMVSSLYAGVACPEWPMCHQGQFVPTLAGPQGVHVLHRLSAYLLIVLLGLGAWRTRGIPKLRELYATAFLLGIGQLAVGIANVLLRIPVEVTGLHSALAASLVLVFAMTVRVVWRGATSGSAATAARAGASGVAEDWTSGAWVDGPGRSRVLHDRGE